MSHSALDAKAVAILLDNTTSSIDGDFSPTRLCAQKLTVERLAQFLFSVNVQSQVALCTLSGSQYGVRASFTSSSLRLAGALSLVTAGSGVACLAAGIKWAVLALRHCQHDITARRILAFVGGAHDIVNADVAAQVSMLLAEHRVCVDIVVIGNNVANRNLLRAIIPDQLADLCVFLEVKRSETILSDDVLASPIGPGHQMAKVQLPELARADPGLARALSLSIAESGAEIRNLSISDLLQPAAPPAHKARGRAARIRKPKSTETDERSPPEPPSAPQSSAPKSRHNRK
jgi:26S proteasome regulatory subunit N10